MVANQQHQADLIEKKKILLKKLFKVSKEKEEFDLHSVCGEDEIAIENSRELAKGIKFPLMETYYEHKNRKIRLRLTKIEDSGYSIRKAQIPRSYQNKLINKSLHVMREYSAISGDSFMHNDSIAKELSATAWHYSEPDGDSSFHGTSFDHIIRRAKQSPQIIKGLNVSRIRNSTSFADRSDTTVSNLRYLRIAAK